MEQQPQQPQINQTTTEGGGTNTVLIVLVIIILLVGGYFIFARDRAPAEEMNDGGGINVDIDLPMGEGGSDEPSGADQTQ